MQQPQSARAPASEGTLDRQRTPLSARQQAVIERLYQTPVRGPFKLEQLPPPKRHTAESQAAHLNTVVELHKVKHDEELKKAFRKHNSETDYPVPPMNQAAEEELLNRLTKLAFTKKEETHKRLLSKHQPEQNYPVPPLKPSLVEEQVERYRAQMKKRAEDQKRLEQQRLHFPKKKIVPAGDLQEMVDRLAQPKKPAADTLTDYWGATHGS